MQEACMNEKTNIIIVGEASELTKRTPDNHSELKTPWPYDMELI